MDKIHLYFNKYINLTKIKKEIFHKTLHIKYIGKITDYYISKVQPLLFNKSSLYNYLLNENNIIFDWSENMYKYYKSKEISKILLYIIKIRLETNYKYFFPNYFFSEEIIKGIMLKYVIKKKLIRNKNNKYTNINNRHKHNYNLNDESNRHISNTGIDSFLINNNYPNYSKYNIILDSLYNEKEKDNDKYKDYNILPEQKYELKNNKYKYLEYFSKNYKYKNKDKSMNSLIKIINKMNDVRELSYKTKIYNSLNNIFKNKKSKSVKNVMNPIFKNKNNRQRYKTQVNLPKDKKELIITKNKLNKLYKNKKTNVSVFKKYHFVPLQKFKEKNKEDYMFYKFYKEWNLNKNNKLLNSIYTQGLKYINSQPKILPLKNDTLYKLNNNNLKELKTESSQINSDKRKKSSLSISNNNLSHRSIFKLNKNHTGRLPDFSSKKIILSNFINQNDNKNLFKSKYLKNIIKKRNINYNNKTIKNNIKIVLNTYSK